jgi:hypothetical protein
MVHETQCRLPHRIRSQGRCKLEYFLAFLSCVPHMAVAAWVEAGDHYYCPIFSIQLYTRMTQDVWKPARWVSALPCLVKFLRELISWARSGIVLLEKRLVDALDLKV